MRDSAPSFAAAHLRLRETASADLPILFEQQQDPEARYMAGFVGNEAADQAAFLAYWTASKRESVLMRTVLLDERVAGSILSYQDEAGRREVAYWLGKRYWGRGIATWALAGYLDVATRRPLYARALRDNIGSLRVLERSGFTRVRASQAFSPLRGATVAEWLLRLD